jgi:cytoskeletal protein CcmA (bactofilin family)
MSFVSNRLLRPRLGCAALAAAALAAVSHAAQAEVTREGAWPESDPKVTLDIKGTARNDALMLLAKEAGWSFMLTTPPGDAVDLRIADQPAGKVLDLLLADGRYVATRDGDLISIAPAERAAGAPPGLAGLHGASPRLPPLPSLASPPTPPVPPAPPDLPGLLDGDDADDDAAGEPRGNTKRGQDRAITGGNLRIEKGEVVHDVSVLGGSLDVWGTVTGDIAVVGGSTHIHEGARVRGDVSTIGGPLTVDDGARVAGDVEVVGGPLERGKKAIIKGDVSSEGQSDAHRGDDSAAEGLDASELMADAGSAVTRMALLFVFGAVLLALWPQRVELLKVDIAARPMKSFALGVVGMLAAFALSIALIVTVVGIPFALIGLVLGSVAAVAGTCAVLETAGAALLNHRTKNPYVHLAAGCAGLLLLGAIPYLGGALHAAVFFVGVGALVSTRLAGLIRPKLGRDLPGPSPYRTAG